MIFSGQVSKCKSAIEARGGVLPGFLRVSPLQSPLPYSSAILPALASNLTAHFRRKLVESLKIWLSIGIQTGFRKPTDIRWNSNGSQIAFRYQQEFNQEPDDRLKPVR
jgi:hypothetical protein